HRAHTPNEPTKFQPHCPKAFAGTAFGSSQKSAPPDHKHLSAPQTLAIYPALKRLAFTETVDVGGHIASPSQSTRYCPRTLRVSRLFPARVPVPKFPPAGHPITLLKMLASMRRNIGEYRTSPHSLPPVGIAKP